VTYETTMWLAYAGGGTLVLGTSVAFGLALRPTGPLGRMLARYVAKLDAECRFQCYAIDGTQFLHRQVAAVAAAIVLCVVADSRYLWLVPPLAVVAPYFVLRWLRKRRILRIEAQLDGWLLILANLLKTTGGLGDALAYSADLVRAPLRQELDQVLKEIRLGATVDDALRQVAERVKSPILAAVVTLLLVGRRTGGELPGLLETAASALREMARLEGVIRTKTAEGRIQTIVLGVAPWAIYFGFQLLDPHYFDPLYESFVGWIVLGSAIFLWGLALYAARKILRVDF
jgi:tight adherence protein B